MKEVFLSKKAPPWNLKEWHGVSSVLHYSCSIEVYIKETGRVVPTESLF